MDMRKAGTWVAFGVAAYVLWLIGGRLLPRGAPFGTVILGVVFGMLYALVAIGLVLIYRANRVINFAQAELGTVGAILAIQFVLVVRMPYWLAILCGLAIATVLGGLIEIGIIRRFREAPRLILSVATIGLAQILGGFGFLIPLWFSDVQQSGGFEVPFRWSLNVPPYIFGSAHILTLLVVPIVVVALTVFLRFTDYGVAIRASAENGDRASLLGIPVTRLSTIVWSVAALLSVIAVILRTQVLGYTSVGSLAGGGFILLLRSLTPAVLGRMENLPVTAVSAIALSIVIELTYWNFPNSAIVDAFLIVVILGALLAQRAKFSRAHETGIQTFRVIREVRPIPEELRRLREVRWSLGFMKVTLLFAVLTLPLFIGPSHEQLMALIFIYAMVAVSLVILTGWAGQISLGHWALVGFGAATAGILVSRHGWDFFLALPAAAAVSGLVSLVIGLPALRMGGLYLAVTTLAFAVTSGSYLLEERFFPWFIPQRVARPVLWERFPTQLDWQIYYVCFGGLMLALLAATSLRRSRFGRALIASRDNEAAAQSVGTHTVRLKLAAFVISGAIAGSAGGLYVIHQQGLNTDSFGPEVSLQLFSMVVIGGLGSIPGAIIGAAYVRGAQYFLDGGWILLASGTGILFLLMFLPGGLGELIFRARDYWLRYLARHHKLIVPSLVADVRVVSEEAPVHIGTALEGLSSPEALPVATGLGIGAEIDRDDGDDEPKPRRRRGGTAVKEGT